MASVVDDDSSILPAAPAKTTPRTDGPTTTTQDRLFSDTAIVRSSGRGRGRGGRRGVNISRGRPRGRRRGSGGSTSGRSSAATRRLAREDPTAGWTIVNEVSTSVMLEHDFADKVISERARLFLVAAIDRLKVRQAVKDLPDGRCGFVVLFVESLLQQCMNWLNEPISLKNIAELPVGLDDMYRYLSVLLLSHCTGFSFEKAISLLQELGTATPRLERIRFIADTILAYPGTGRGDTGDSSWISQRDQTQYLLEFETVAYRETRKIFFVPTYLMATLDDDLYGTRASDNQVKSLSARKADREGHTADTVADALFRVVLAVRFNRRSESQKDSVRKLIESLVEGRGEQALAGFTLTADRGYAREAILKCLMDAGVGAMFIMPEHILRAHPFVGKSFMDPLRYDEEEMYDLPESASEGGNNTVGELTEAIATGESLNVITQLNSDRRMAFVVDDNPDLGPSSFYATKRVVRDGSRATASNKITAVAVREHGSQKFSKIIRFLYNVSNAMSDDLKTWIAVPRGVSLNNFLFSKRNNNGKLLHPPAVPQDLKDLIQSELFRNCSVLSAAQRCADWFVMRQFRITGTNADKVLMESGQVRGCLNISAVSATVPRTDKEWLKVFCEGWFSSAVSTEPMMRGSLNEGAVLKSIIQRRYIKAVYNCGMLGIKNKDWLACSPDAVALIDAQGLEASGWDAQALEASCLSFDSENLHLATIEIKTKVACEAVDSSLRLASIDAITCTVGDCAFAQYVSEEHIGQVLHQVIVTRAKFIVYVVAAETGIIYTVVAWCPPQILQTCNDVLSQKSTEVLVWAHSPNVQTTFSDYVESDALPILKSRHAFWRIVNDYVRTNGPFPPLKLFRHSSQSLYSKTKGGVDGATQARAILRSSTSNFKWEQKLVSQTLKTLTVNAFIAWRMHERKDLLESRSSFRSLDSFRNALSKVQSMADFVLDVSKELLTHADVIKLHRNTENNAEEGVCIDSAEVSRMVELSSKRKRQRISFFNGTDGKRLRLSVPGHEPTQKRTSLYCALCGQNLNGWRGHQSSYKCNICPVHLCVRVYPGLRKSCFSMWHSASELTLRSTNQPTSGRTPHTVERENEPSASQRCSQYYRASNRSRML